MHYFMHFHDFSDRHNVMNIKAMYHIYLKWNGVKDVCCVCGYFMLWTSTLLWTKLHTTVTPQKGVNVEMLQSVIFTPQHVMFVSTSKVLTCVFYLFIKKYNCVQRVKSLSL